MAITKKAKRLQRGEIGTNELESTLRSSNQNMVKARL